MPAAPCLVLRQLAKRFGAVQVLCDLDLEIARGEVFALLGPSGSGKTTALRLLAGFEQPDAGEIRVDGEDVTRQAPAGRRFGMVFQHYALFPHLTVGENVAFGLASGKAAAGEVAAKVAAALALVELPGYEKRPVTALSGGQQQRVALARALAPEPRVLLLDEPLSNLDPALRERTRRALATTIREIGITTVLVTHEQEEAFDLGARVGVLHGGRLAQVGTPEELYECPQSRFVATFVGRASFLPARLVAAGDGLAAAPVAAAATDPPWPYQACGPAAAPPPAPGTAVELCVRPEGLTLVAPGTAGALAGRVVDRRYGGAQTLFAVELAGGREIEVLVRASAARAGDAVGVALATGAPAPRIFLE